MSFLQRTKDFRLDRLVESYMEDLPMLKPERTRRDAALGAFVREFLTLKYQTVNTLENVRFDDYNPPKRIRLCRGLDGKVTLDLEG